MSILRRLKPDTAFAAVLDKKVEVHTSATQSHTIRAYKYGKQPNKGVGDEFILVRQNGVVRSLTQELGIFRNSNIEVTVRCKLQTNNTTKDNIIDEILGQIEDMANRRTHGNYFYWIGPDNLITPTTPMGDGYSTTVINIRWKPINKFYLNNN